LALVRDLREHRVPASAEELADFETDVLAEFVLARAGGRGGCCVLPGGH
jgi:integrase/recombinase XerD